MAALQFFGRYRGHSGHQDALEPEGSVAMIRIGSRASNFAVTHNTGFL